MTLTFDTAAYRDLLTETIPRPIESEEEYDRLLAITERLHFKSDCTPEETALYQLLVTLIESYEQTVDPIPAASPLEMLTYLMETSETRQADLVGILGSSGVVSEVVNGKRTISKAQAKALGDYFQVSPSLFI
ncbi:helix-turn-helix domain-containing protein [Alkalinema pantanalense CENA528]|uniref:helix-turn-helix domain-containing protein n=1 Tax=Alkalinema pantanalense TaxID=1620705 RepID=UPI003D6DDFB6